jgi:bisphosphoglycerate-dependent phosphoglycerate mutase
MTGEIDALDAGRLMKERGLHFDIAFTSNLQRAWRSCELALEGAGESHVPVIRSWRLNERHYGLLQGYSKDCEHLRSLFGEEQLVSWRRSYTDTPPSLNDSQLLQKVRHSSMKNCSSTSLYGNQLNASLVKSGDPSNIAISSPAAGPGLGHLDHDTVRSMSEAAIKHMELPFIEHCPSAESLKACEIRAYGYWRDVRETLDAHLFCFLFLLIMCLSLNR